MYYFTQKYSFVAGFHFILKAVKVNGYGKRQKNLAPNKRRSQITIREVYENHIAIDTTEQCCSAAFVNTVFSRKHTRNAIDFKRKC